MARSATTSPRTPPLRVTAEWRTGPRTTAWDALWRRIFAEVLRELPADATGDGVALVERQGGER